MSFCDVRILLQDTFFAKQFVANNLFVGGGKRDRTADLLHAMQALSQLSYTPDYFYQLKTIWRFKLSTSIQRRRNIKDGRGACQCFSVN